jgi:hypothetical protein
MRRDNQKLNNLHKCIKGTRTSAIISPVRRFHRCVSTIAAFSIHRAINIQLIRSTPKPEGIFTYVLTYEAEPFLRSCQLCSYSRTSQHFMELQGSLPCSQEPSTGPYPERDRSGPYHPILSKIHFNIAHPPTSWSS